MYSSTASFLVAALAAGASAHMNMANPPPLKYKGNPNAKTIDSDITSPNTPATFPCKGALDVLGTGEDASVATWAPGSQQTITIEGGAAHNGGSCQVSLSYDKGTTFTVIYSKEGNCPTDPQLSFTVPSDAPTGDTLLAWSWINHTGNREYYMNCASITIGGSSSKRDEPEKTQKRATTAFADRPALFVANLEGKSDYCVKEGVDVLYPEPGPDVDNVATAGGPPVNCDTGAAVTGGSGSGSGSGSSASATAPAATSTTVATTSAAVTSSAAATASTSLPGGVFVTIPVTASSSAAQPTTLQTKTTAAGGGGAASSSAVATKTSSAAPSTGTGGSSSGVQTGACTDEGSWACAADGQSFQRCASGQWSAAMPMAAGTSCTPGISDTLSMQRRNDRRVRRSISAWAHI